MARWVGRRFDRLDEAIGEDCAIQHLQEGLLDVDRAGHELARTHAGAVLQLETHRLAVLDEDAIDSVLEEDAAAGVGEGLPEGVGEGMGAADTDVPVVDLPHQQREGGRQPAAIGAVTRERGVEGEVCLDLVVLEVLIEKLVDATAAEAGAQELGLLLHAPGDQRLGDVVHGQRRREHQGGEDEVEVALRLFDQATERVGVLLRETGDRGPGLVEIGVDGQRGVIAEDRAHLHRRPLVAEPVLVELQIAVDGRDPHQGVIVAVDVVQEARPGELLGAEPPALLRPLLEDGDVQPALGEVGAEGQTVVAGSDDHRVVGRIRHERLLRFETPSRGSWAVRL